MDILEIQRLVEWLIEKDISEFEINQGGTHIRIQRTKRGPVVEATESSVAAVYEGMPTPRYLAASPPLASVGQTPSSASMPQAGAPAPLSPAPAPAPPPPAPAAEENLVKIASPLVGTFYSRANPKAEPFVKVGDKVTKGKILCIVEAMKVMNEIASTADGEIAAVHVEDGTPVEFGEALFTIRPA
mgnify:CR=1 FL=1